MRIKNKKTSRSRTALIWVVCGATLVAIGVFAYTFTTGNGAFGSKDSSIYRPTTQEEKGTGEDIKKNSETTGGSDPSPAPTPSPDGGKSVVGMNITSTNQDSNMLYIRALLQTVTSTGLCKLSMTGPSEKLYSAEAPVQALPSTSTCKGFNVPVNSLSPGVWKITIEFENDSLAASISKEVIVK